MLKNIVAHIPLGEANESLSNFAVTMAAAFDSHVEGVAFVYQPFVAGLTYGGIPADIIAWQRKEGEQQAQAAVTAFNERARREGVAASIQTFNVVPGAAGETFGTLARRYDLAIVPQPNPEKPSSDDLTFEGALFASGRPTLVVPYIHKTGFSAKKIVACWDGSRTAARAIGDAMPILKKSSAVDLLMVSDEKLKSDDVPGADMGQHLARHGVNVTLRRVSTGGIDIFNTILSYVADNNADMLVMGGFGHSRFREFVLGGVTRGIVSAMTIPTLMSH